MAVLTSTVGESLPEALPDGDVEDDFEDTSVRVREGEPEGLRDARPETENVGVPVDVLLEETDPDDVFEPVEVFDTEEDPVSVLDCLPDLVSTGERDADFDAAEERVAVLVDVAVLLEIADDVLTAVPKMVAVGLPDFVEVLEGKPEDL